VKNYEVDHSVAFVSAAMIGGALLAIPFVGVAPLVVVLVGLKVGCSVVEEMTNGSHKTQRRRRRRKR
jgi:hypothetical protein